MENPDISFQIRMQSLDLLQNGNTKVFQLKDMEMSYRISEK